MIFKLIAVAKVIKIQANSLIAGPYTSLSDDVIVAIPLFGTIHRHVLLI